jgi:Mg-chelatase subunit ChlD
MQWTGVVLDSDEQDDKVELEEASEVEALEGKMARNPDEERLMHSIMENDEQKIDDGKLLAESVDYALGSFTPDLMFEKLVQNYRNAQRLFGPTIIRELTGYEGGFIERNLKVNEFREELRRNIHRNVDRLKKEGLLDKEGSVTEAGLQLASLVLYTEELDHLQTHGLGKRNVKEKSHYGEKDDIVMFQKQRYKDIDIRASIMRAIRRGHSKLEKADLKAVTRKQEGKISIIYALDASGSMRGQKLNISKKAGIALAFKAIADHNDVGLVVFTSKIERSIPPTREFVLLLDELTKVRAGQETDIGMVIDHALTIFEKGAHTKHLILITDALATRGEDPGKIALEAASKARAAGITISMVGINLEKEGEKLAKQIVELGEGKLYRVTNLGEMDTIILEDYERLRQ